MKKLRTIEEENRRREDVPVVSIAFPPPEPHYKGIGVETPFGGELLQEVALQHYNGEYPVKCSKTGKTGIMKIENCARSLIEWIKWDDSNILNYGRRNNMIEQRKCCSCGKVFESKVIPGPPEPPPFSCGEEECDKERVRRIMRIVG